MPSKRGKQGGTEAEQRRFSLLDLPLTALALVAEHSKPAGHPLLGVARGYRDAVLSQSKKISLKITSNHSSSAATTARLLSRACCTAPAGLHLDLDLSGHEGASALLLKPALLQLEGWPNVHKLTARFETSCNLHVLSSALPALRHLSIRLNKADLVEGVFFSSLALCTRLTALHLHGFRVSDATAIAAAAALARLPNLRELGLRTARGESACPSNLVKHLTALTSLCLYNNDRSGASSAPLYETAARNPGLLSFSVANIGPRVSNAPAAQVQQLLKACPSLTHLNLQDAHVQQDTLDVLLAHGTNITSLRALTIQPYTSIATREVPWRQLVLTDDTYPTVLHLANLPLQSVTSLQLFSDPDAKLGLLVLPTGSVPAAQLPGLLLQATTNLARCPAWQRKPESQLALGDELEIDDGEDDGDDDDQDDEFTQDQRLELFQALAPLSGPHVRHLVLGIKGLRVELGKAEVAALAQGLGKGLPVLWLRHCTLAASFWAALDDALPSLMFLALDSRVKFSATNVGIYCGRRATGSRLVLGMSPRVYQLCGHELQQGLDAQGLTHISVLNLGEVL